MPGNLLSDCLTLKDCRYDALIIESKVTTKDDENTFVFRD